MENLKAFIALYEGFENKKYKCSVCQELCMQYGNYPDCTGCKNSDIDEISKKIESMEQSMPDDLRKLQRLFAEHTEQSTRCSDCNVLHMQHGSYPDCGNCPKQPDPDSILKKFRALKKELGIE